MDPTELPKREYNREEGILTVGQLRAYLEHWDDHCLVTMEKSGLHFKQAHAHGYAINNLPVPLMHDGITLYQDEDLGPWPLTLRKEDDVEK